MRFGRHPAILGGSGGYAFIRALQPAAWYRADSGVTVTGQGVSTLADQSGNGRDLLQGTDASRPPYLGYSGTKYLYLPGAAGNYASTPDSVANSITGDIDIRVRVALDDWTTATIPTLIAKRQSAGQVSYRLQINAVGQIVCEVSSDGTALLTATSSSAVPASDGGEIWVRYTRASASGAVLFYTSADGSTWTQLGTPQSTAAGNIFDSTSLVEIGSVLGGTTQPAAGKIYRAIIKSGIDGTTVVDFNPDRDASDASTSFASSATGETWTVNQSGGLPAQIVGRSSILFDGTADYLKTNAFTLNQPETVYIVFKQVSWTSGDTVFDGSGAAATFIYQLSTGASPDLAITAGSPTATNANLAIGSYGVVSSVFNGASSSLQVNLGTAATGDASTNNSGGVTIGARGGATNFSNIQVLEVILAAAAHDAPTRSRVIQYLSGRHGIAL